MPTLEAVIRFFFDAEFFGRQVARGKRLFKNGRKQTVNQSLILYSSCYCSRERMLFVSRHLFGSESMCRRMLAIASAMFVVISDGRVCGETIPSVIRILWRRIANAPIVYIHTCVVLRKTGGLTTEYVRPSNA